MTRRCSTCSSTGRRWRTTARRSWSTILRSCMASKVGIIGLGMAVTPHAKSLIDLKDRVEVAYAFSPSRERRAKFAERFPFPQCDRLETLLEDRAVNAVLVLTPPNTHLDIAARCAAAGKHVLLEKPLEISTSRAEQLVQSCRGVKLGVVLQHRFRPAAEKLHELLPKLGKLVSASAAIPNWRPQSYYDQPGRGTLARDGGGVLLTPGIHTLDFSLVHRRAGRGEELRRHDAGASDGNRRPCGRGRALQERRARRGARDHDRLSGLSRAHRAHRRARHGAARGNVAQGQPPGRKAVRDENRRRRRRYRRRSDGFSARLAPRRAGRLPGFNREEPRAPGERRRGAQGSPLHRQNSSIRRLTRSGASSCGKWPRPGRISICTFFSFALRSSSHGVDCPGLSGPRLPD